MKKFICCVLSALVTTSLFAACQNVETSVSALCTVSFVQEGEIIFYKLLNKGETLTDIPQPKAKEGYTIVWDKTGLENITDDITVTAIVTANTYVITYDPSGGTLAEVTQEVTYGEAFALPKPERAHYLFEKWVIDGTQTVFSEEVYTIAEDITLSAVWKKDPSDGYWWSPRG
ncbi:MAG: InlB B-repeat-containing protein [Clostridia bacterium]|nr:InlB B-repeat-containing protein [Clostridia bacterium]